MSTEAPTPDQTQRGEMFSRLRVPAARSHNHRPAEDIARELRIGPVEGLLLWLSKTDIYVLALSSRHTRLTLASLGMMVLFTSLLAFCSSFYALLDTLVNPDSAMRWPIATGLALLYSFGIMIIDREIVGSTSMKSLPIRFVFAIGIAVAVSFPVKLKFFEGRVTNEIEAMIVERNKDKLDRIETLKLTGEPERQQQRAQIQERINSYNKEIAVLDGQINYEANLVRCDVRCQNFREQKAKVTSQHKAAEDELRALSSPSALPLRIQQDINTLEANIAQQKKVSYDFLSKWEALGRIKHDPKIDYEILSYFLFGFFMLLEMVPMALKWSLGKTEYHYYIEARSNLGNQKIISLNNVFMEAMQRDPHSVLEILPLEITDLIAAVMEDESISTVDAPVMQYLMTALRRGERPAPVASPNVGPGGTPQNPTTPPAAPANSPTPPTTEGVPPVHTAPRSDPAGAETIDERPPTV